jgi:hypothetical protein
VAETLLGRVDEVIEVKRSIRNMPKFFIVVGLDRNLIEVAVGFTKTDLDAAIIGRML